jgi:hypothetical protein
MFIQIDRFVLSKVEKFTQYLQRQFGVKLTTIISMVASIAISCILIDWYFTGMPSAPVLFVQLIAIFFFLKFIFLDSKHHQSETEKRSMSGVSNPLKIDPIAIFLRLAMLYMSVVHTADLIIMEITTPDLIFAVYIFSLCMYVFTFSVDALPPNTKKEEGWLRNLFRRLSPTT